MNTNSVSINPDYLQNGCTRAEALRAGQLHDVTQAKAAQNSHFAQPTAITAGLWRAVAGENPFALDHPLLLLLLRVLAAAIVKDRYERRQQGLFSETAWLHLPLAGRQLHLKLVCHPGDTAAPVLTMMEAKETAAFEL